MAGSSLLAILDAEYLPGGMSSQAHSGVRHRIQAAQLLESVALRPVWSTLDRHGEPTGAATLRLGYFNHAGRPTLLKGRVGKMKIKAGSASMTTTTSKMDAVSFSLPAGTVQTGGSCIAAIGAERMEGHICRVCYAWGRGNYGVPNVILTQYARLRFLQESLGLRTRKLQMPRGRRAGIGQALDPVERTGELLAIAVVAENVNRKVDVLVPDKKRPGRKKAVKRTTHPADYLRLHDSGDFFHPLYIEAWAHAIKLLRSRRVLELLPPALQHKVAMMEGTIPPDWRLAAHFEKWGASQWPAIPRYVWAPTRMWALVDRNGRYAGHNNSWIDALQPLAQLPNVAIRPSSLRMASGAGPGDPPPKVSGLAAGAGIGLEGGAYPCPVYNKMVDDGGEKREARSCTEGDGEGPCRRCWDAPKVPISYGAH